MVTPKFSAKTTVVEITEAAASSVEVAGSWHLRLCPEGDGGLSFLASDRLAGRSIQFAAGVGESNQLG